MNDLLQRVEAEIQNRRLLRRGQRFLVAVSGGVDSMVLLHMLHALSEKMAWKIVVAHFNHQLRGRASNADERLVRKTAAELNLPVVGEHTGVKRFAKKLKLSVEMAARKLRHGFLARAASKRKIKTVALAHHADDQVELFFLRLLRGAGSEGLAGMKWRSPSPLDPGVTLVRPMLNLTKAELQAFARENKIHFREDATNFSFDAPRNRIRNELLPLLRKKYQPGLAKTVLRLMEIVGAESDFAGAMAREWLHGSGCESAPSKSQSRLTSAATINKADFANLSVAVQRRILQSQLLELGVAADFDLIESLRRTPDVFVCVGSKTSMCRTESADIKLRTQPELQFNANELATNLSGGPEQAVLDGVKLNWHIQPQEKFRAPKKYTGKMPVPLKQREFFDADTIGGKIVLRHWRPGDRFQPIGLKPAAKLQDLFTNAKIPRERRRRLIVAEAAGGEIFWVEGLRIGENFKLTPQTRRQLVWRWRAI